jgi:hypothetical protein
MRTPFLKANNAFGIFHAVVALVLALIPASARADYIWVEGEKPVKSTMQRHPWWYDQVKKDQLSGGDFISHWSDKKPGLAEYRVAAPKAGDYEFWARVNPVAARLSYRLNDGAWTPIDLEKTAVGNINIARDGKIDLRFLAWVKVGKVALKKGANSVHFRMDSKNNNHGMLDCFVFSSVPFRPRGILKPDEIARAAQEDASGDKGWFAFDPEADPYKPASGIDLRYLNEKVAGENGFIQVKEGRFVHAKTGAPVRFWAVNGPSGKDRDSLRKEACLLAKHGVNLVRVHGGYFNESGEVDLAKVRHAFDVVEAMKAEGIYCHFSIYFPLWLRPRADTPWLKGYDGKKLPFASLYFNEDFQKQYRSWWKALLLTRNEKSGTRLIDDPAVAGLELVNEDSYFFWTFNTDNVPDPQMRILESQFGAWLKKEYGSLDAAFKAWNGLKVARDKPEEGRVSFRPLWNMFNERPKRDQDAARFLALSQRDFYKNSYEFLKKLGFKGAITASNWATASPQVFGPLEKYTYTACDFIDRHGYFGCRNQGSSAEWSVRNGHTYADRSALRFDPEEPGKPKLFVHPAMDVHYAGKPSMISETTWNRPNRYRSEAPLYYAVYGALQGSDAIVHFAQDTAAWSVKPGYFMQPWTLMSPAMMGQFPAAALIFRKGLVAEGDVVVDLDLKLQDLFDLKGTPLPQDAAFDELRLKDVPQGTRLKPGNVIDPLVHYVGRTQVNFSEKGRAAKLKDVARRIDREHQTVTSSTRELKLDYGKGVLTINAAAAQGVSGDLRKAGKTDLDDTVISSSLDLGHIVLVSLDGRPLATSRKILIQVLSEEKASGFRTEPAGNGVKRITDIGHDPWLVRNIAGTVKVKRADAARLRVAALDMNGYPIREAGNAAEIKLDARTVYYLIRP